jgi:histone acetyltransferase (RNA polymerase elongator complex component)
VKTPIVPFFIPHHGCPHQCVFCNQRAQTGAGNHLPDAATILETVKAYQSSSGGRSPEVAFFGGTFTALSRGTQERLLLPLQPLLRDGTVCAVRVSTRPDSVSTDGAAFLKSLGVGTVELGAQSMDDAVLARSGRGHTAGDTVRASRILRESGIRVGMQLMPGLPGDSPATARSSLDAILSLEPAFLRLYPLLVMADTPLAEAYRSGTFSPWSLAEAVECCKVLLQSAEQSGVTVVRLGVQASDALASPGTILAGPWHPAFGQLVESARWHDLVALMVAGIPAGSRVEIACARGRVSSLVGQRRGNVALWEARLGVKVSRVAEDASLAVDACLVRWQGGERQGSLLSDLVYR